MPKYAAEMNGRWRGSRAPDAAHAKRQMELSCSRSSDLLVSRTTLTGPPSMGHQHSPLRPHPMQLPTLCRVSKRARQAWDACEASFAGCAASGARADSTNWLSPCEGGALGGGGASEERLTRVVLCTMLAR